jgi:hypothetical protein
VQPIFALKQIDTTDDGAGPKLLDLVKLPFRGP